MSLETVENLLAQVQALPRSERNKFSSYKSREMKKNISEVEAVARAAAQIGIYPTVRSELPTAVGEMENESNSESNVLPFPKAVEAQSIEDAESNTPPTAANTLPTAQVGLHELRNEVPAVPRPNADVLPTAANTNKDWFLITRCLGYGLVFLMGTIALIYLSAEAGGGDSWAYFWAVLAEGVGALFLIHPASGLKKVGLCLVGAMCIMLGFSTMLTGITKKSDKDLTQTVASDANVKDLETEISLKTKNIASTESLRDGLPSSWVSKKREAQRDIDLKTEELSVLYSKLKAARGSAVRNTSAGIVEQWTYVETYRRLILLLVNVVAGHALVGCLSRFGKKYN